MSEFSGETTNHPLANEEAALIEEQRRDWLVAAMAGDDDAKAALCMSYQTDIRAYISSREGADPDTADDITQITMMRLWKYDLADYTDHGDGLKPFVITTAKNIWRDNRRSLSRRGSVVTADIDVYNDVYYPVSATSAEQQADDRAEIRDVLTRLQTHMEQKGMGPHTLTALALFADGYTDAEIAELQDTTPLNVRQRVARARRLLKNLLEVD